MSTSIPKHHVSASRCAGGLLSLILATAVGCMDRDPDYHFPQREALGMSRDELFQKLVSQSRNLGDSLHLGFILEDGRKVPYSRPDRTPESVNGGSQAHDRLRLPGQEGGKDLPKAYSDSRIWRWSVRVGQLQSYEYTFGDDDRVAEVTIFYPQEGGAFVLGFVGFYWVGSICSAGALLYMYRRRVRGRPGEVPRGASLWFDPVVSKECGIALLAGMVAVEATAVVVDPEMVLGMGLMILPLLASMVLYYIVSVFSRSLALSLCAFLVLPICAAAYALMLAFSRSQTV